MDALLARPNAFWRKHVRSNVSTPGMKPGANDRMVQFRGFGGAIGLGGLPVATFLLFARPEGT